MIDFFIKFFFQKRFFLLVLDLFSFVLAGFFSASSNCDTNKVLFISSIFSYIAMGTIIALLMNWDKRDTVFSLKAMRDLLFFIIATEILVAPVVYRNGFFDTVFSVMLHTFLLFCCFLVNQAVFNLIENTDRSKST